MKVIDAIAELDCWLNEGVSRPAAILGLDLSGRSRAFETVSLAGCYFLGCKLDRDLVLQAYEQGALVIQETGALPESLPAFGSG